MFSLIFVLYQLRCVCLCVCVDVSPNSLGSLFVRMNFPPFFVVTERIRWWKKPWFFNPPKNTLTHLSTVEQKYLHPVYSMPKCRPVDHAPRRCWNRASNPRQSRGFVAFVLFRGWSQRLVLVGWFLVGEGLGSLWNCSMLCLVGTKTLNYCKISVEWWSRLKRFKQQQWCEISF